MYLCAVWCRSRNLRPERYDTGQFDLPTVKDILHELEKFGRDPRATFKNVIFKESVVTNVAVFGAFVDICVHHQISLRVADKFVKDAHSVIKARQVVKDVILEVR